MRARAAYISSLTTTSIMLASAVLMLVVFGALVGFKRWPAGDGGSPADPIGLGGTQAPLSTAPAAFTRAIPPAPLPARPVVRIATRPAAGPTRRRSVIADPAPPTASGEVVVTPTARPSSAAPAHQTPDPAPSAPAPLPTPPKEPPGPLAQATGIVSQVVAPVVPQSQPVLSAVSASSPSVDHALGAQVPVVGAG